MLTLSKQRGFSLIELMVGVVIVGLLFALAAPNFSAWMQNQQIRTAAESILNGIQVARSEAVKNNSTARFVLCNQPDSSWEVFAASSVTTAPNPSLVCTASPAAGLVGEVLVQAHTAQEGARMALVDPTPDNMTTVTFNGLGRVVTPNADGTAPLTTIDVSTPTGDRPLRINLGAAGSARMCDPDPLGRLATTDPRHC